MPNKMLIDAAHPEETRVVVVRGNRVEEFDFESATRRPLRGNIYLAKVTRVEPSLQAAFVDYGGNRHGFLAFSEIHPDYYQIPVADRRALMEAEEREAEADDVAARKAADDRANAAPAEQPSPADGDTAAAATESADGDEPRDADDEPAEDAVESVGAEDAMEEVPERRRPRARQYKIQEVIRRRQVLLVQVVKEERGAKGAALTTYLSLAGRYSVLMPNTARGGGISRKITSLADRKRLKTVAADLEVPEGMGVILRTAGASRTKAEVKRDFEYLLRLWESVRELTLRSTAPALVYEEGSLIKRSIRDLYGRDIDEILVAGDDAYREAKDFMRMLMPSHAKNVQPYKDPQPIFGRFGVEPQLDAMFSPHVPLPAGGYIVLNQTEALVSIDVNSGRSTREHSIEDTALQTNLEASEEVARQLRLRDLAGLIVIDFIDMEERRNNRSVENRLKDCLKDDRARIQVGQISHFGLLEMSRQRIRTGVVESTTDTCPHCMGTGHVRSASSVALHVLRSLEDQLLKNATHNLTVRTRTNVALYILNQKRAHLSALEHQFGLSISVIADESVNAAAHFILERGEPVAARPAPITSIQPTSVQPGDIEPGDGEPGDGESAVEPEAESEADAAIGEPEAEEPERVMVHPEAAPGEDGGDRKRRRRRRRRRGEGPALPGGSEETLAAERPVPADEANEDDDEAPREGAPREGEGDAGDDQPRRRRRGRRGGRRAKRGQGGEPIAAAPLAPVASDEAPDAVAKAYEIAAELSGDGSPDRTDMSAAGTADVPVPADSTPEPGPVRARRAPRGRRAPDSAEAIAAAIEDAVAPEVPMPAERPPALAEAVPEAPAPRREPESAPPTPAATPPPAEAEPPPLQKRGGWWQRRSFF